MDSCDPLLHHSHYTPPHDTTRLSPQGTTQVGAAFNVGLGFMGFSYYLLLRHEPKYQTFTWTLDYRYSSDFGTLLGISMHLLLFYTVRLKYSSTVKFYYVVAADDCYFLAILRCVFPLQMTMWVTGRSCLTPPKSEYPAVKCGLCVFVM